MMSEPVFETLDRTGEALRRGVTRLAEDADVGFVRVVGHAPRTLIELTPAHGASALELKTFLQQELLARGVLWSGHHTVSYAHDDNDVTAVLAAYREALPLLGARAREGNLRRHLRGELLEAPFRRATDFHTRPRKPR
jgi:glutamate-1-semialdehyde aminotransferase